MRVRRSWMVVPLLLALLLGAAGAEEVDLFQGERFQGGAWRLRAEKVLYDAGDRTYTAEGRVEVVQGDRRLSADQAVVHETTKVATLQGRVVIVAGEDILTGESGAFNLATRMGELQGARLFVKRNHFHVDGRLIRKTGENSYYAEGVKVTTCDADRPFWSFTADRLTVVQEGQATAHGASFRLAGVPVLYMPWTMLPVGTQRQSGFLMPNVAFHRTSGSVVELPFYWAITNHMDATFFQTVITSRGYLQGLEYRYRSHREGGGTIRGSYLYDRKDTAPTHHRFWVAGMMNQPLGDHWQFRGTVDRVSDGAYLKDFNFGYLGAPRYSRDLLRDYGRDLEAEDVKTRVSHAVLSGTYPWGNFTAYGRFYQHLRSPEPLPYQRMPGLAFSTVSLPVGQLPLRVAVDSSYTYFYQKDGQKGQRLDLHPQILCNLQPVPALQLQSRVGFRETLFRINQHVPDGPTGNYLGRTLYDLKVSLASHWFKDFGRDGDRPEYLRHLLRPEISYWNMPRYDARRFPAFDPYDLGWRDRANRNLPLREGDDPLGGVNAVTYGFSSHLLRREQTRQGQAAVRDILWFRFTQSAFFTSTSMALDGTTYSQRRFSDLLGELEFYPWRRLTLGFTGGVSPYREGFNRANVKVVFYDRQREKYLNINYLYIKNYANQINITSYLDLLPSVKTWLTTSYTLLNNRKLERQYGIILQRQCWGVAVSYTARPDDQRVGVSLILPGLTERFKKMPVRMPDEGREDKPVAVQAVK